MPDITTLMMAAAGAGGEESDDDFASTVLLLHGDGTNGAQNNTFLDSSTNNFTITRNGNTTQGSFSPFSKPDGRWGNFFDGVDDVLISSGTPFNFGAGDFTFEMWIYPLPIGSFKVIVNTNTSGGVGGGINSDGTITIGRALVATDGTTSNSITFNAWNHVAWVRNSGTVKIYINGVEGFSGTITTNYPSGALRLGSDNNNTLYYPGYISNVRLSPSAVYTSGFTPSTSPLTTSTSPTVLTCQSNQFKDNSGNALTFTTQGTPSVQPFSPFPLTTEYSPAVNGGSGYFDGSGDSLKPSSSTNATNYGTGDFTVEFWFYANSVSSQQNILDNLGNSAVALYIPAGGGSIRYYVGADRITGGAITPNQWYHIALVRSSGSTKLYLNGTQTGSTYADTNNYAGGTTFPFIGVSYLDTVPINGYLTGLRIVKGTAVYTTTFTPPTAPPTAVSGTSLLLNFTNAGIFDNTGFNNLETVGNAQIDTTTKKYGTGSLEFDGNGDYLVIPNTPNLQFGTGDFTIEGWFYPLDTTQRALFSIGQYDQGILMRIGTHAGSDSLYINNTSYNWNPQTYVGTNAWYHIALVRYGSGSNNVKIYVNGTSIFQATNTSSIADNDVNMIGRPTHSAGEYFNGYIDDLRITKGVARYTTTFTPPTKAFPNIGA